MVHNTIENKTICNICKLCETCIRSQDKACAFRSLDNSYCQEIIDADNALSALKKQVVDITIKAMNEETKAIFAKRLEEEEGGLNGN